MGRGSNSDMLKINKLVTYLHTHTEQSTEPTCTLKSIKRTTFASITRDTPLQNLNPYLCYANLRLFSFTLILFLASP